MTSELIFLYPFHEKCADYCPNPLNFPFLHSMSQLIFAGEPARPCCPDIGRCGHCLLD